MRGGENISPREIEEFLYTHPDIVDGHVIGVPDAKYGEELMAVIKLRDGTPGLTIEQLREFCEGKIAGFKIPRYLWIVDEFPMTVTGKVRKVEIRQQAIEHLRGPRLIAARGGASSLDAPRGVMVFSPQLMSIN